MKICLLFSRFPWPEAGGDLIRVNRVAGYLKSKGHQVTLMTFYEDYHDTTHIKDRYEKIVLMKRNKWISVIYSLWFAIRRKPIQCGYYYSPLFYKKFKELIAEENYDRYICWSPRMSEYFVRAGLEKQTVMEMSDAISKTYKLAFGSKSGGIKKIIYAIEQQPMYDIEQDVIFRYPKVILVAKPDVEYLRAEAGRPVPSLVHHSVGVDVIENKSTGFDNRKICFIGNMRTLQNQDAALRFVNDIFPLILKKIPDARFYIVGAEPTPNILQLDNQKNVFVTGFVDDLIGFISDSCLSVAPVEVAAGIQNKVLMAMGAGIPVVMSRLISKAIPELREGEDAFICDDYSDFANKCIELMTNKEKRELMSSKGAEMIKMNYSWDKTLDGFELFPEEMKLSNDIGFVSAKQI